MSIINFFIKLIKTSIYKAYVILLLGFMVWAGALFYPLIFGFEGKQAAAISLEKLTGSETPEDKMHLVERNRRAIKQKMTTDLGYKVVKEDYIEGHFHHIGLNFEHDVVNACVYCHGEVPHDKNKETRSYLNMHSFSIACELCHVDKGNKWRLGWYAVDTGNIIDNPESLVNKEVDSWMLTGKTVVSESSSKYGAKITLIREKKGELVSFSGSTNLKIAKFYMKMHKTYDKKEQDTKKKRMHANMLEKAFECDYCHGNNADYMDYAALGYPPRRVKQLTDSAIVSMIGKYKKFYFPNLFGESNRRD